MRDLSAIFNRNRGSIITLLAAIGAAMLLLSTGRAIAFDRGRVGQAPVVPDGFRHSERSELFLADEPEIRMTGDFEATLLFRTVIPSPPARVYYGVVEPDSLLPMPHYRLSTRENDGPFTTDHQVTLDLTRMLRSDVDITGMAEKGGGAVEYRIEIYNPARAVSVFYDSRFAFRGGSIVPEVVDGPFIDLVTDSSAVVSGRIKPAARAELEVDGRTVYTSKDPMEHFEVPINELEPGTTHRYRVVLADGGKRFPGKEYSFRTPAKDTRSFAFAVMGDSREGVGGGERSMGGVNQRTLQQLLVDARNRGAEFVVGTGDLVNGGTTDPKDFTMQLAAFRKAVEPVAHTLPIYEVMGNHELVKNIYLNDLGERISFDQTGPASSEALFAEAFVNPRNGPAPARKNMPQYDENVYFFDYGQCRFVVMNNNYWRARHPEKYGGNLEGYVLDDQYEWLLQVFTDTKADTSIAHLFLFAQAPMFPSAGHVKDGMWYYGGDPELNRGIDRRYVVERRNEIWRAFTETGKAVAANFGHEHCYHRTFVDDSTDPLFTTPGWQIVSGGAGAPYYAIDRSTPWAENIKAYSPRSNYTLFRVEGGTVKLEAYSLTGELLDSAVLVEQRVDNR